MSSWKGKARGGLAGHKFFVFILKTFGLSSAYFILRFVAFYFLLFSRKTNTSIQYYYSKRLGSSYIKSLRNIYKGYYVFGQVMLDKVAFMPGLAEGFEQLRDEGQYLDDMDKNNTGGILTRALIVNFEAGGHLLND